MSLEIPRDFDYIVDDNHPKYPIVTSVPQWTLEQLLAVDVDDETLRDGAQGTRRRLNIGELCQYIDFAHEAGVRIITPAIVQRDDTTNQETIAILRYMRQKYPEMIPVVLTRTVPEDLKIALSLSDHNPNTQFIVFQSLSRRRAYFEGWKTETVLTNLNSGIYALAHEGRSVIAFTEQTSQSYPEDLERFLQGAVNHGAQRVGIADTVGYLDQFGAFRLVKMVRDMLNAVDGGKTIGIDGHFHRDVGMEIEAVFAAIAAGADRIHGTLYGVGERAGNAPLDVIMFNINRYLKRYGVPPKYDLHNLKLWAQFHAETSLVPIPAHWPLIGENAQSTQAGIHAGPYKKIEKMAQEADARGDHEEAESLRKETGLIYTAYNPEEVGSKLEFKIGPMSSPSNVLICLHNMGYEIDFDGPDDPRVQLLLTLAYSLRRVLEPHEIIEAVGPVPTKE